MHYICGTYDAYGLESKTRKYTEYGIRSELDVESLQQTREDCMQKIEDVVIKEFGSFSQERLKIDADYTLQEQTTLTDIADF